MKWNSGFFFHFSKNYYILQQISEVAYTYMTKNYSFAIFHPFPKLSKINQIWFYLSFCKFKTKLDSESSFIISLFPQLRFGLRYFEYKNS